MKMDVGCCVEPNIVEYKGTRPSKLIRIDKIVCVCVCVCVSGQHEINNVLNFFLYIFEEMESVVKGITFNRRESVFRGKNLTVIVFFEHRSVL